jgi:hypothetical protein
MRSKGIRGGRRVIAAPVVRSAESASAGVRPKNALGIGTPLALLMIRKYSSVVSRSPPTRYRSPMFPSFIAALTIAIAASPMST